MPLDTYAHGRTGAAGCGSDTAGCRVLAASCGSERFRRRRSRHHTVGRSTGRGVAKYKSAAYRSPSETKTALLSVRSRLKSTRRRQQGQRRRSSGAAGPETPAIAPALRRRRNRVSPTPPTRVSREPRAARSVKPTWPKPQAAAHNAICYVVFCVLCSISYVLSSSGRTPEGRRSFKPNPQTTESTSTSGSTGGSQLADRGGPPIQQANRKTTRCRCPVWLPKYKARTPAPHLVPALVLGERRPAGRIAPADGVGIADVAIVRRRCTTK
jgi:hypothetical protein